MRNAQSVAVFWDLPDDPTLSASDVRLCLRMVAVDAAGEVSADSPEILILHHETGHAFIPLAPLPSGCQSYRFTLGWNDGSQFHQIAEDEVEMPILGGVASRPVKAEAVEAHGFHPLAMAT